MTKPLLLTLCVLLSSVSSSAVAAPLLGRGVKCPAVLAFTKTGKYVRISSSSSTCFGYTSVAKRKGYKESSSILCNVLPSATPAPTVAPAPTATPAPASFEQQGKDANFSQTFKINSAPAMITFTWSGWTQGADLWIKRCKVLSDLSGRCTFWEQPAQQESGSVTYFIDDIGSYYLEMSAPNWTVRVDYR